MPNNSATGGALAPNASPAPLEGDALVDFFQVWIVSLTGLPGAMIRPRWQPEPPNIPDISVDWAAFGIMRRAADTFAAEIHHSDVNGYDELRRHEVLHLLISFYGPNADNNCHLFRDGMQIAQNLEYLSAQNMGLVESGEITTIPEFIKERWQYRVDMPFSIRRQIVRQYQVLNILTSQGTLNNEYYITNIVN